MYTYEQRKAAVDAYYQCGEGLWQHEVHHQKYVGGDPKCRGEYGLFCKSGVSDMPKGTRNLNATEDRILRGIDEIDCLKKRYRQAQEYMAWFAPTWKALSEDERYCLKTVYWSDNDEKQIDLIMDICDYFGIERTTAYNNKNKAVDHLSLLLYGK